MNNFTNIPVTGTNFSKEMIVKRDNEIMSELLCFIESQGEFKTASLGTFRICDHDEDYFRVTDRGETPTKSHIDNYVILERTDQPDRGIKVSISLEFLD